MDAFLTPRAAANKDARRARILDPAPGRTRVQSQAIRRALVKVAGLTRWWLEQTNYQPVAGWLPHEHVITAKDDEWMADLYGVYSDQDMEDDGYMPAFTPDGVHTTNNLRCVMWYRNDDDGEVLLSKRVWSPLPCDEWGLLPINLHQWRIVAELLITRQQLWQWIHAVRHYYSDPSFQVGGFIGWHLDACAHVIDSEDDRIVQPETLEPRQWTGHIIYKQITDGFSLPAETKQAGQCPQS